MNSSALRMEDLCGPTVMSAHYIAGQVGRCKTGAPGKWHVAEGPTLSSAQLDEAVAAILPHAQIDVQTDTTLVAQFDHFRIVYVKPPVSSQPELTIVRSVKTIPLPEYNLPEKALLRLAKGHGLLVAGGPGHGKSTFVSAIIGSLAEKNIVKTVEAPRDLIVPKTVTQLSRLTHDDDIRDILLLSRPDIVCIDEVRHKQDSALFCDLRMCGIGCFGVIHASQPVDALSRYIHHVGIGQVAHTVDTVVFLRHGTVHQVLDISLEMKVPVGLKSKDLSRPVLLIKDLVRDALLYEVFMFSDQVMIVDAQESAVGEDNTKRLLLELLLQKNNITADVTKEGGMYHVTGSPCDKAAIVELISKVKEKISLEVHVHEKEEKELIPFNPVMTEKGIGFQLDTEKTCTVMVNGSYVLCGKPSKKGILTVKEQSNEAQIILDAIKTGKRIEVFALLN